MLHDIDVMCVNGNNKTNNKIFTLSHCAVDDAIEPPTRTITLCAYDRGLMKPQLLN